jgi:hypothetical protein
LKRKVVNLITHHEEEENLNTKIASIMNTIIQVGLMGCNKKYFFALLIYLQNSAPRKREEAGELADVGATLNAKIFAALASEVPFFYFYFFILFPS